MPNERLVVVDDNALNLKLMQVILEKAGYMVACAKSAEEALSVVGIVKPRLILLDLQLPGMDGLTLARHLKADSAKVRIVAVTAYAMKGDEEKALAAGCDAYLTKPIDRAAMLALVAQML